MAVSILYRRRRFRRRQQAVNFSHTYVLAGWSDAANWNDERSDSDTPSHGTPLSRGTSLYQDAEPDYDTRVAEVSTVCIRGGRVNQVCCLDDHPWMIIHG